MIKIDSVSSRMKLDGLSWNREWWVACAPLPANWNPKAVLAAYSIPPSPALSHTHSGKWTSATSVITGPLRRHGESRHIETLEA